MKVFSPYFDQKDFCKHEKGYARDFVPLLPAMLAGAAVNPGEGSAQPAKPHHTPVDPTSPPPHSPLPSPPHPSPPPHSPPPSPHQSPPFSPPHYSPPRSYEASRPEETELQQTKITYGKAVLTLVKRVKILEKSLQRKTQKVVISRSEGEEPDDQGRKNQDINDDPLVSLVRESMKEKSTNFGVSKENQLIKAEKRINTGIEEVSTGSAKVDSGTASKRGQREGKAPMVEEDIQATHKTKEQIRQEAAGLEEAIRLQAQMDEEVAKQIHLDKMLAKRVQEEQELSEQQLKRKAEVQKAAQFYTEEDWDTIRAKLEANTEVVKVPYGGGKSITIDDLQKNGRNEYNEKTKFYFEQKAKAKKLKTEFEKLMKSIESFVPMETEARVKRHGLQLEQETLKKQKIDIQDASITTGKDDVVKEEETEVSSPQGDSETDKEESVEAMNPTPLDTKSNIVANWKIFQQGERSIYQIIRANGADTVYMSFGAMLKDFTREDLIELYRLVMQKYGTNRPEDAYDRVLWSDLRTMFDPPLNEDAIWSLPLQQKMISWRYYDKCAVHCLTLEACNIYMLADRKYPLSKDACQVMLKMKLLDGKMNEVCYKLLKMIEKQAGLATPEQTATGKENSNPLIADSLLKTIRDSTCSCEVLVMIFTSSRIIPKIMLTTSSEAHNEDIQRNLKFTSDDQVRGGLLGIIVNRHKSGSYRVKSGRLPNTPENYLSDVSDNRTMGAAANMVLFHERPFVQSCSSRVNRKLYMVNGKEGAVYDVDMDTWPYMPAEMLASWRGPMAVMDEDVILIVDEIKGVLRKFDDVMKVWVDVVEDERQLSLSLSCN
ncbi:hypothetical protein Tco_0714934 [Tanacetum coccineum]